MLFGLSASGFFCRPLVKLNLRVRFLLMHGPEAHFRPILQRPFLRPNLAWRCLILGDTYRKLDSGLIWVRFGRFRGGGVSTESRESGSARGNHWMAQEFELCVEKLSVIHVVPMHAFSCAMWTRS